MDILPLHFRIFQIFGFWYNDYKRIGLLKFIHGLLTLLLPVHFTLFQLISLIIIGGEDIEAITSYFFLIFTYVSLSFRILFFLSERKNVRLLLNKFRLTMCQPKNSAEKNILFRNLHISNKIVIVRMVVTLASGSSFFCVTLINNRTGPRELPFNGYEMFNITSTFAYSVAFFFQVITTVCSICLDACLDSTICAFMILISGQLELLCHRILSKSEDMDIKYFVMHHNLIHILFHKVQKSFISIILLVFCCQLITLCSSIFQLAKKDNTLFDCIPFIIYLSCVVCELYYYCWCGNVLKLKNSTISDAIFHSDWLLFTPEERRSYWFIMYMSRKELVISCKGQCELSLNTFIWMLKTSFAAFNLLQQVSNKA